MCWYGEIGRRKGLKIPRWQHRTGSNPVTSTKLSPDAICVRALFITRSEMRSKCFGLPLTFCFVILNRNNILILNSEKEQPFTTRQRLFLFNEISSFIRYASPSMAKITDSGILSVIYVISAMKDLTLFTQTALEIHVSKFFQTH